MPFSEQHELETLLSALTDALLAEKTDLDSILRRHPAVSPQAAGFVVLIQRLHQSLIRVQPSKRFVRRLKQDLTSLEERNVITRVRHLPARVQIAAGIAVIAGFMLLSRRRVVQDARRTQEAAPAQ